MQFLTRTEKRKTLEALDAEIAAGLVPPALVPFLARINEEPEYCTTMSSMGNGAQPGYVSLRTTKWHEPLVRSEKIPGLLAVEGVLSVDEAYEKEQGRVEPRFIVYFDAEAAPYVLEQIVTELAR